MPTDGLIDYSDYSLQELYEARGNIDRERYPRNAQLIDHWIKVREGDLPTDTPPPEPVETKARHEESLDKKVTVEQESARSVEPVPPLKDLSFTKVISDTVALAWQRKIDLARALVPIYIIIVLLEALGLVMAGSNGVAGGVVISIVSSVAYAMFAVSCHRIVLLGNDSIPKFGILVPSRREFGFWGMTIALSVGIAIIIVPVSSAITFTMIHFSIRTPVWLSVLFVGVPFMYLTARMSLAFPAIALDEFKSLGWCWSVTRGNGIALLALILIPIIPIYLMNYFFSESDTVLITAAITLIGFAFAVLGIIFISLSYKELCPEAEEI